jgi:hypothetical protein
VVPTSGPPTSNRLRCRLSGNRAVVIEQNCGARPSRPTGQFFASVIHAEACSESVIILATSSKNQTRMITANKRPDPGRPPSSTIIGLPPLSLTCACIFYFSPFRCPFAGQFVVLQGLRRSRSWGCS